MPHVHRVAGSYFPIVSRPRNTGPVPVGMPLCPLGYAAPVPMRRGKRGSVELNRASGTVGMQGRHPKCHCVLLARSVACLPV